MEHIEQQPPVVPALSSNAFLLIVALFPIAFAAVLTVLIKIWVPFSTIGADTEYASISAPFQSQSIGRNYHTSGVVKQSFADRHLFIIEHSVDGIFPKAPINQNATDWSMNLYTGAAANNDFRVVLVSVNDAEKDLFFQWFKTGETTGQYPGIAEVPSMQELSAVTVRVAME